MPSTIKAYFCAIMLKTRILIALFLVVGVLSSCKKDSYDAEKQAKIGHRGPKWAKIEKTGNKQQTIHCT